METSANSDTPAQRGSEVESLLRGLRVLEALAGFPDGTGPQKLGELTGLDRSTLQRLIRTLVSANYVERLERGRYGIAAGALTLASRMLDAPTVRRVAHTPMAALQAELGEIMNLAVLRGTDVVYVARFAQSSVMSINLDVGSRLPAYCTSLGRAILAWLPEAQARAVVENSEKKAYTPQTLTDTDTVMAALVEIRELGYALVDQELDPGLRAMAVPVRNAQGQAIASIDISLSAARATADEMRRDLAPKLLALGAEVSRKMGYAG